MLLFHVNAKERRSNERLAAEMALILLKLILPKRLIVLKLLVSLVNRSICKFLTADLTGDSVVVAFHVCASCARSFKRFRAK